jgi:thiol-disulfide isomerase/thioredoxin
MKDFMMKTIGSGYSNNLISPRLATALLALVLTLSCAAIPAFAQTAKPDFKPLGFQSRTAAPAGANGKTHTIHGASKSASIPPDENEMSAELKATIGEPEIPRLRIGWHVNDGEAAVREGLREGKPVFLFFHAVNCGFCDRLLRRFQCPAMNRYAGRAVFNVTIFGISDHVMTSKMDPYSSWLYKSGDIKAFPTVLAVIPGNPQVRIVGQSAGELSTKQLEKFIRDSITNYLKSGAEFNYPGWAEWRKMQKMPFISLADMRVVHKKMDIPMDDPKECHD